MATLEQRHQLMNTEATVDNNFELFEAQRIEEIKVNIFKSRLRQGFVPSLGNIECEVLA